MKGVLKSVLKPVLKGVLAVYNAAVSYLIDLRPSDSTNARIVGQGTNDTDGTIYSAKAIDLDGATGFINTNQATNIDYTDAFTVSCRVNCADISSTGLIISNNDLSPVSGDDQKGFWLGIVNSGKVSFNLVADSSNDSERLTWTTPTNSVTQDKWIHITVSYDGLNSTSSCTITIDGVEQVLSNDKTGDLSAGIVSTNNIYFGAYATTQNPSFNGQIAETTIDINGTRAHTFGFESGKEAIFFDSTTDIAATLQGGATWITGLSGFNYELIFSQQLRDNPGIYYYFDQLQFDLGQTINIDDDRSFSCYFVPDLSARFNFLSNRSGSTGFNLQILEDGTVRYDLIAVASYASASGVVSNKTLHLLNFSKVGSTLIISIDGVEVINTSVALGVESTTNVRLGGSDISSMNERAFGIIYDVTYIENGITIMSNESDFSSFTAVGSPRRQQFPEIGLPQPANRNSNLYDVFDGATNYVTGSDANLPSGSSDRSIIIDFIFTDDIVGTSNGGLFAYGTDTAANQLRFILRLDGILINNGAGAKVWSLNSGNWVNGRRYIAVFTFSGSTLNDFSLSIAGETLTEGSNSGTVNTVLNEYVIGANLSYGAKSPSLINSIKVYSDTTQTTKVLDITNASGWVDSVNAANGTRNGTRVTLPIPAKSTNAEEDIFDQAIVNSIFDNGTQIAWNLQDGQSSADTNATEAIDSDVSFEIGISNFLFTDTGALQVLLSNRNTSNNGLLIYITSDKKLAFRFQYDASNYIDFSTPALTEDTDYESAALTYDGASGVTISVNDSEQSLTDNSTGSITGQTIPNDHSLQIGEDPDGDNKIQGLIGRTTLKLT